MKSREQILTFCHICAGACSVKATVEEGKIVAWEPDTESGLPHEPCPPFKGLSIMELASHPDRLRYPQKRVGARGEGKWARISWDEALDTIAEKFRDLKQRYGPESVGLGLGEPKGMEFAFAQRFASAFGTPNVATPSHLCAAPDLGASFITFGTQSLPHSEKHLPRLIILWGSNLLETGGSYWRETTRSALIAGAKLVVIDPKRIDIAKRADLWIRPRPASDGALALGILKVIIEEKLYDADFVAGWTSGFEQLQEHVKSFSLGDVETVTWVPRRQVEELARLCAERKPMIVHIGNGLSHGMYTLQACRAIHIMRAITGNVNIPGREVQITPAPFTRPGRFMLLSKFPRRPEKTLGNEFKWAMMTAYIPYQALIDGILEDKVKAALFVLTNPLSAYPDARKTYQALMKLDFMAISEIFPTPTTAVADIVLPAATGQEHHDVGYWGVGGALRSYPKLVEPPGESWPDPKIINELAKRLSLGEYFWDDYKKGIDLMVEPSGLSFPVFQQQRLLKPKIEYVKSDKGGFGTPSGKVEVYSPRAEEQLGCRPLPRWEELSRFRFATSAEYPLLLTNRKEEAFMLTGYKHIASLRKIKPEPLVELHPETAARAGLKEGDYAYIETRRGRIKQKVCLDPDLDPRVVFGAWGWWFPEEPANLYGWDKSNFNILTEHEPPYESTTGSVDLKGIPCRVYKAED